MKKLTDEQIQAMLEIDLKASADTLSAPEDEQMQRYQSLFQNLNREPEQGLPFNFASKVTGRLKIKLKRRSDIRFNLLALLGIVTGLVIFYSTLTVVDIHSGSLFLLSIIRFKWLLISASIILLGSLMFEQNIVEKN
jgi:hypothetical protein